MAVKPKPTGYHTVTPYLVVDDVASLIDFVRDAFDAVEKERMTHDDGSIRHAEVRIGDSMVMMGPASDQNPARPAMLHLYVDDVDATYAKALEAGATSIREPADEFYGDRSGGVKDANDILWWIATHIEDVSPEEMQRRARES